MPIYGEGGIVKKIYCGVAEDYVAKKEADGLKLTESGQKFFYTPGTMLLMPVECPLLMEYQDTRKLGEFAVCLRCTYSNIEYDGLTAKRSRSSAA